MYKTSSQIYEDQLILLQTKYFSNVQIENVKSIHIQLQKKWYYGLPLVGRILKIYFCKYSLIIRFHFGSTKTFLINVDSKNYLLPYITGINYYLTTQNQKDSIM